MKRITLKNQEKKKDRTKQFLVGAILIGIMFFSVLGYSFMGGEQEEDNVNKVTYNGFEFIKQDNYWFTGRDNLNFIFTHNPNEVERIYSEIKYFNNYYGKPLYVYSETREAELEIYRNFDPSFNPIILRMQPACLNEEECNDKNLPIKTCEYNFIIITQNNVTDIIQNESCVFIQGPRENLTQITDEFLFKVFEIT